MLAAWKWVKVAVLALLLISLAAMWQTLQTREANINELSARLEKSSADNATNLATIDSLHDENSDINTLLVERKKAQDKAEGKLHADIAALKAALANDDCYQRPWPPDVTERLREPY